MSHRIISERVARLELIKQKGVEPYPTKFSVTHTAAAVLEAFESLEKDQAAVAVAGRLLSKRGHGKASFGHILDRSGKLQAYFREDVLGPEGYELFGLLDVGDIIGVTGPVFRTRTGEVTVKAESVTLLSKSLRPLPEKWHGLKDVETRYRQRYVDLIVNTEVRRQFVLRSRIVSTIRRFLDSRGFIEVETPILQPLYGGAFARPFVTRHEALDMQLYLRIADELYLKRLLVGGLDRVYEIGKDFRNEGIDRTHNPEFTQLEVYQAYADYQDIMDLVEEMLVEVVTEVHGGTKCKYGEHELDFARPWKRVSYFGALKEAVGADLTGSSDEEVRALCVKLGMDVEAIATGKKPGAETGRAGAVQGGERGGQRAEARGVAQDGGGGAGGPVGGGGPGGAGWGRTMVRGRLLDELFSEKAQPNLIQPTFVYDYPKEVSPLAKDKGGSPGIVERFEPIVAGLEVGNAFSEQNDPLEQARQFDLQAQARADGALEVQPKDTDYLRALEYGMAPAGGLGLGIDRIVMILTDARTIRDVVLFPQLRAEALREEDEREDEGGSTPDAGA
ncbi:MAG: lysine--tRNA ligase [Candidatus Eisenbacteria bacterium]|nr:lysine--tRNA ligase [Candidatus Eisenbacteria bacterium]